MKFNSESLLSNLNNELQQVRSYVNSILNEYSREILNKKPSNDSWSFMECLEHMNRYGDYYIPQLKSAVLTAKRKGYTTSVEYKSGWLGDYFTNGMLPKNGQVSNKMRTLRKMNPVFSNLENNVAEKFINQIGEFEELCVEFINYGGSKPRIPITISKLVRLKPIDTLRFSVAHTKRHTLQLKNILNLVKGSNSDSNSL